MQSGPWVLLSTRNEHRICSRDAVLTKNGKQLRYLIATPVLHVGSDRSSWEKSKADFTEGEGAWCSLDNPLSASFSLGGDWKRAD